MGRSEAWEDIQPALRSNAHQSTYRKSYLVLPDKIVDILIDASEHYFIKKRYILADVEKYCKKYLKEHGYTFDGSIPTIEKVVDYFKMNRDYISDARNRYPELLADSSVDIDSLPGGVCNKVDYLLRLQ